MDYEHEHKRGTTTRRTPTTHGHEHGHTLHTPEQEQGHAPAAHPALTPEQRAAKQAINTTRVNGLLNRRFGLRTGTETGVRKGQTANAPSPYARQVAHDLARPMPDYVGAIQAMDRDPDAHERQRLAATITSHLDAHLGSLSMYEMLRTLQPLKTHGYLARFATALEQGASGVARDRLAFALAVIDTGTGALDDTESHHYLADRKPDRYNDKAGYYDDYEGAVTYLKGAKSVDMNGYDLIPVPTDPAYLSSLITEYETYL